MKERKLHMAAITFEDDGYYLSAHLHEADAPGDSLVIGTILARAAHDHPEIFRAFEKLCAQITVAALTDIFGPESRATVTEATSKPS